MQHSLAVALRSDRQQLAREFAESGHVQMRGFLDPSSAEQLRDHLANREDWVLAATAGARVVEFPCASFEAMSASQRAGVAKLAEPAAETGFRYMYDRIWGVDTKTDAPEPDTLLGDFVRLMSSDPALEMLRSITGKDDVTFADGQATRYRPGHFLTRHGDIDEARTRRVAYVLGLTEGWRAEWGGLLLFHDDAGDVTRGVVPRMNVLNLFSIPQDHSVSAVAPFASRPRYSVSGWLRA